jgi:hypothetical protein
MKNKANTFSALAYCKPLSITFVEGTNLAPLTRREVLNIINNQPFNSCHNKKSRLIQAAFCNKN